MVGFLGSTAKLGTFHWGTLLSSYTLICNLHSKKQAHAIVEPGAANHGAEYFSMAASVSPTAHLLRTSRLFSLPPPLRKATYNTSISSTISATSPTATMPFPSNQAIQTTAACSAEGDWGLKRPLPLKSTINTTTPIIRVTAIDTIDHITDFESAADHTMSLRKWQEMNIPITLNAPEDDEKPMSTKADEPFRSVFESEFDKTYKDEASMNPNVGRWKFKGPWLAGQTEGEFQDYIKTTIRRKRGEFRAFIKLWMERELTKQKANLARQEGQDQPADVRLSNDDFEKRFIAFRQQTNKLNEAIWEFLDLPGSPPRRDQTATPSGSDSEFAHYLAQRTAELGPPATHPAAGISYLRSAAYTPNHPFLGPQKEKRPILGRVLRARNSSSVKNRSRPAVGVGGFVSDRGLYSTFKPAPTEPTGSWNQLDPDLPGGNKVWVYPLEARVDQHGRVKFHMREAEANGTAIWEGKYDDRWPGFEAREAEPGRKMNNVQSYLENSPYGLGPEKLESLRTRTSGGQGARLPERDSRSTPKMGQISDGLRQR